jgi:hypothetical protein
VSSRASDDGHAALEHELRGEQASALGRAGRSVEEALAELAALPRDDARRAERVDDAAYAVWCYFVQRECIGVRNHQRVIEFYRIPNEVLARVGAVRR